MAVSDLEEQQRLEAERSPLGELEKAVDEAGNVIMHVIICVVVMSVGTGFGSG